MVYGGRVWGVRPIASHLRIVPDFCYWRGLLVLAGDQADNTSGQPQSGFWSGGADDLWAWGKPAGWGGVWRRTDVAAGEVSDPFLMTGFDRKVLHLTNDGDTPVTVNVEVDPLGDGVFRLWRTIDVPLRGYRSDVFPEGFSAHWLRLRARQAGKLTAEFFYS